MSALVQRWAYAAGRLRAYVRTNPLAQKAIFSAGLHALVILSLLLGSMISCRVRAARDLAPFDLQSFAKPGKVGGGAAAAVERMAVSKPEDGLEILKRKPVKPKSATGKTRPAKPTAAASPLSRNEIEKILGSAIKDVGSGSAAAGIYGTRPPPGGGTYDPLGWYYSMVRAAMYAAWQQPSALAGTKGLMSRVSIRVKRDGQIAERSLLRSSGNALMDSSVMTAVESVEQLQALPPGFGGDYKEIDIDFELTETPLGE